MRGLYSFISSGSNPSVNWKVLSLKTSYAVFKIIMPTIKAITPSNHEIPKLAAKIAMEVEILVKASL